LPEVVSWESSDGRGWAQQDGVGGRDGVMTGSRERHQLAAPVIGMRLALYEAMGFQFVDDESYVRGVEGVGLREFAEGHRPVMELKEDFAAAYAEAKSERLGELAVAVVGLDETSHEGPGLRNGIGWPSWGLCHRSSPCLPQRTQPEPRRVPGWL
jgi:hypothetical protein